MLLFKFGQLLFVFWLYRGLFVADGHRHVRTHTGYGGKILSPSFSVPTLAFSLAILHVNYRPIISVGLFATLPGDRAGEKLRSSMIRQDNHNIRIGRNAIFEIIARGEAEGLLF